MKIESPTCENHCPPLETRTCYWGDSGPEHCEPYNATIADFQFSPRTDVKGVSVIFVDAVQGPGPRKALRDCHTCRSVLSSQFDMPPVWWEEYYVNASSYFGFQEVPMFGAKQEGTASWCRFKVKHTILPREEADAKYYWAKLNVFSRWYKSTNHTFVLVFDPEKMRPGDESLRAEFVLSLTDRVREDGLSDPFWIYPPLLEFVVKAQDKAVWDIRDLVRRVETGRGKRSSDASILENISFPTLYDFQRHAVHVCETLEVAISTTEWIGKHHELFLQGAQPAKMSMASRNISNGLLGQQNFLTSLLRRSESNKTRLNSEIGLAFNMVAQYDSRLSVEIATATKRDSAAMRAIAFVSLLFLPATFTSAIFSTTFFKFDDNSSAWQVSDMFWLYWVVAIPLTAAAVLVWSPNNDWQCFVDATPGCPSRYKKMAPTFEDDKSPICVPFILQRLQAHRDQHQQQQHLQTKAGEVVAAGDERQAPANLPPLVIGLSGMQGVGKTTLVAALANELEARGARTLVCSIDDFYLTHADQRALAEAQPDNALVQHRGEPGTHDVALAKSVLDALIKGEPTHIPQYDKAAFNGQGDRRPASAWTPVNQPEQRGQPPVQVVILEGWCVGFRALPDVAVEARWRAPSRTLRNHALPHLLFLNGRLRDYDALTDRLGAFVHVDSEDVEYVYAWRLEQEEALRRERGDPSAGMTPDQVVHFVDGYFPGYELYTDGVRNGVLPGQPGCQLRMIVGRDRKVKQVVRI
ncbi:D-glycerate 3-kinase [Purpureocillium lavendulum]|uniref:D-glycerate 3-kinase n=1 Tax=Purpureocillium lavendulum TaxID=1247861 RepID=A0AB34FYA6_9HYPO|nr:D-glycerate 3-kinase [Purpureocillium lavendulum]